MTPPVGDGWWTEAGGEIKPADAHLSRMTALDKLAPHDDEGALRVVVEVPRGCAVKLKYAPDLGAFEYGRLLPLGLTYPYDWGFVPGTKAEDGDPLDALVLADVSSFPGVVIPCRALGTVLVSQRNEKGKRERNDRLVVVPVAAERLRHLASPRSLPARMREEIERFFLNTTFFTQKDARIEGWRGPRHAQQLVRSLSLRLSDS
jgi:inorganic pyrophosphatase